jgi:hypothetical protein
MRKIITGLNAGQSQSRSALHRWVSEELGPGLAARQEVRRLTLNLVGDPPAFLPVPPAQPGAPASYDVLVMMWIEDDARIPQLDHGARAARVHSYLVEEILEKSTIERSQGRATPGIKNLPMIVCHDRHDDAARRACWRVHAALGKRIHTGMGNYARNVVLESLEPGAPEVHGIAEVGFARLQDLQFGLFPKPGDREEFLEDIRGWVKASTPQYAAEHVLKW